MEQQAIKKFQKLIWDFYKKNKRNFPWRETADPYHILVSEVMLQQTQADRVIRYYDRFLKEFPTAAKLSKASFAQIYELWQGLGYNRRGLALQKAAQKAVIDYKGKFPNDVVLLEEFPGIGPYTARAVSIFSFNTPVACIETNIRRVFIHHFFHDKENVSDEDILRIAEKVLPSKKSREWHWALMDYGSHLRTTLSLSKGGNPNRKHKNYAVQSKFEGSLRQIRGAILRILSAESKNSKQLESIIKQKPEDIQKVLAALEKENMIVCKKNAYSLN